MTKAATATNPIPLREVEKVDGWPFSHWHTGHLIRRGELGCIRSGRRVFVTVELLDEYLRKHQVAAKEPSNDQTR